MVCLALAGVQLTIRVSNREGCSITDARQTREPLALHQEDKEATAVLTQLTARPHQKLGEKGARQALR